MENESRVQGGAARVLRGSYFDTSKGKMTMTQFSLALFIMLLFAANNRLARHSPYSHLSFPPNSLHNHKKALLSNKILLRNFDQKIAPKRPRVAVIEKRKWEK